MRGPGIWDKGVVSGEDVGKIGLRKMVLCERVFKELGIWQRGLGEGIRIDVLLQQLGQEPEPVLAGRI